MLGDPRTQSLILKADDPFLIRDLIPNSKTLDHPDYNVAIKYDTEAARVLRNLGIDAPAPLNAIYNFPGKYPPMSHQRTMGDVLTMNKRCFNLSEMGAMKTAAALWAADSLMVSGEIKKCVILSKLSTLTTVWLKDLFDVLMHRRAVVVHGGLEKRLKAAAMDVDFYIVNHEGIKCDKTRMALRNNPDIGLVIVDEAGEYRNDDTDKYRALRGTTKVKGLLLPHHRLWLMTGTPCPNAPTDAWALARLVDPSRVPQFFGAFHRQTMMKVSTFKSVPRADAYEVAFNAMQPAVRFMKQDCIDLPPVTSQDRQCPLSSEQRAAFEEMKKEMQADLASGHQVLAVNAADKIGKMRQILCGAIKLEDGSYTTLDHKPRLSVLREVIDEAAAKVIVVVPFKGIIKLLAKELEPHYSVGVLNGDVSPNRRNQIIHEFKTTPHPHILLCHPKVTAHGLNFTEADTTVFYAPIYSNDEFQQVIERMNRAGQKRKMTIVRIGGHSLEWGIYAMVDNKRDMQDNILDLFKIVTQQAA